MIVTLPQIRKDGGTQPRAELSYEVARSYAEDMSSGACFPPVVLFFDGESYWLADGFHRVLAAELAHQEGIEAEIRQGTQRDAILFSVGVNAAHGLRRSNEDKRRAVLRLLQDEEWARWSDRAIAERCAVSDRFVNYLRAESTANGSQSTIRKGQDGRTINTAKIGKARAPDPVNEMRLDQEEPPPRESAAPPPEPETTIAEAVRSESSRIENRLILLPDLISRHEYVNALLKFLKGKAAEFNRAASA